MKNSQVNGKAVSIKEKLHTGDVVEIQTGKNQKPNQDWVNYVVTSKARTKIRQALESGDIAAANAMLGYPYGLKGVVVAGNRLGRTIGFPTANMQMYEPLKLIPSNGVYVVDVNVLGKEYRGMCNIGVRPTVGGSARTIETNIFDFDEDIYGLDLSIRFRRFLRPEKKFSSLEELKCRLALDRIEAEK